ncbi:ribonuclease P protein component [Candidatus Uhrbacteria bacterium]|nr:ribonuclease P protein component [Candidatus Uhrbacteria bacterium]
MLPRQHRLSRDRDIQRVWKHGRGVSHDQIQLRVLAAVGGVSQLTVIVPLKLSKRATVRNRVKRQLRAIVAKLLPAFTRPVCGLVFVHAGYRARPFAELEVLVRSLCIRARMLPPLS